MLDWFWDPVNGGLYTTAEDAEALIVRQKDLIDNATPSANSTAAIALYRLAALTGEQRFANHADRILQLIGGILGDTVGIYSNALLAVDLRRRGLTEVADRRRPGRPGAHRPHDLAARHGARLGRTVRIADVAGAHARASATCAATTRARRRRTPSRASSKRSRVDRPGCESGSASQRPR